MQMAIMTVAAVTTITCATARAQPKAAECSTPDAPRCTPSLSGISIQNGDTAGWTRDRLQPPAALLKVVIQRSGCFTVVERGAGLDAALRERDLAGGGNLQRGSNVGGAGAAVGGVSAGALAQPSAA